MDHVHLRVLSNKIKFMKKNKIKLFADGLKIDQFDLDFGIEIDGYTFNPSIFKNHGAKVFLNFIYYLIR